MNHKLTALLNHLFLLSCLSISVHAAEIELSQPSNDTASPANSSASLSSDINSINADSNDITQRFQLGPQVEFLPVEEAFQVTPSVHENGQISLNWSIADGYYLYQHKFKFTVNGEKLNAQYPNGKVVYDPTFEQELEVYYHKAALTLSRSNKATAPYKLKIEAQGCADAGLCYAPTHYWLEVDPSKRSARVIGPPQNSDSSALAANTESTLWLAILSALIGGLILNLMPCVFPVLSIKALSLAEAHQNIQQRHLHGWSYTAGVVMSFVAIAALMLGLKSAGQSIGWGFQLQSPIFVSLLAYLFFAMGLSLSGFAEFGNRLMGIGSNLTLKSGYSSSFYTGVLASAVASPCTAPFMGTALGFALGQPTAIALLVFAALGFGMAIPFLLLSYLPGLGRRLPKPGVWMETLKQALAFPLYLTAIWLVWVLGRQSGSDAIAIILSGALLLVLAFWLQQKYRNRLTGLISILLIAFALGLSATIQTSNSNAEQSGPWQSYTDQRLQEALSRDQSIFVNATAAWCLTCLANERIAFSDRFFQQLATQNTLTLKADWTNYNPEITQLLKQHGRSGVPLYLFIDNGETTILPQLLTESSLLQLTKLKNRENTNTFSGDTSVIQEHVNL